MLDARKVTACCVLSLLAACGGGGGGGGDTSTSSGGNAGGSGGGSTGSGGAATVTAFLVDGPMQGVSYSCAASGAAGTTGADGSFSCQVGDASVSFSLNAGAGVITLGSVGVPPTAGVSIPVASLQVGGTNVGLKVAEILLALNHGTDSNLDVTGVTLPAAVVAQVNAYIAGAGTLPAGQASDDQFLASVQAQAGGNTSFTHRVTGTGNTFAQTVVVPHLQDTIVAISQKNPPPTVATDSSTRLSGTIILSQSGIIPASADCPQGTWSVSGGGILNATVQGDIQKPGAYPVSFSSPGFSGALVTSELDCNSGKVPAQNIPIGLPIAGSDTITVSGGNGVDTLALGHVAPAPAGCAGGAVAGTDVGASNPLITLTAPVSCQTPFGVLALQATAKLVGAYFLPH